MSRKTLATNGYSLENFCGTCSMLVDSYCQSTSIDYRAALNNSQKKICGLVKSCENHKSFLTPKFYYM